MITKAQKRYRRSKRGRYIAMRQDVRRKHPGVPFELTFEEYEALWLGHWRSKGNGGDQYRLARKDSSKPFRADNMRITSGRRIPCKSWKLTQSF